MNIIYGAPFSPFVKKVIVVLKLKGMEYTVEPVTPFNKTEEFIKISPLGKIPAYKDASVELFDSSVICDYLDNKHPEPSIYPKEITKRALTLNLEEYADTRLAELLGRGLVYEKIVKPYFLKEAINLEVVNDTINNQLPKELEYLNSKVLGKFMFGSEITIADITIGSLFLNASYADYHVDNAKYPKLSACLNNIFATDSFKEILNDDKITFEKLRESALEKV